MSFFKKIFKRKGASASNLSQDVNKSDLNEAETEGLLDSPSQTNDVSSPDDERSEKLKQLRRNLKRLQRQNGRLRRRRQETLALDAEVTQVVSLIAQAKRHVAAFDDEIVNKKCELNYLQFEITAEHRSIVKKNEPVYSKRLSLLKTSADAQNLLIEIRERLKIFRLLEVMIYHKGLELKHKIGGSTGHASTGSKRSATLLKNKHRHLDHLAEAIRDRQTHAGAREIAMQSMALAQVQSTHSQSQPKTETSREIQCFRMPSPEMTQALTSLPPPSGGFSAVFSTPSPLAQGSLANTIVPMPPPLPNMETSI